MSRLSAVLYGMEGVIFYSKGKVKYIEILITFPLYIELTYEVYQGSSTHRTFQRVTGQKFVPGTWEQLEFFEVKTFLSRW